MTSLMLEDLRRKFRRQQIVIGVMLGVTAAGFFDPVIAFGALVINATAWASWYASLLQSSQEIKKLEVRAQRIEETVSRE